jgi:hypothetical protein
MKGYWCLELALLLLFYYFVILLIH